MPSLQFVRYIIFGIASLFSLIVLAISAWFISFTTSHTFTRVSLTFNNVGLASSILTLVGIALAIVLEFRLSPTSPPFIRIIFEGFTILLLSILWIVSAALAGQTQPDLSLRGLLEGTLASLCRAWPAIIAFSVLALFSVVAWGVVLGMILRRSSKTVSSYA